MGLIKESGMGKKQPLNTQKKQLSHKQLDLFVEDRDDDPQSLLDSVAFQTIWFEKIGMSSTSMSFDLAVEVLSAGRSKKSA